jgi:site-specific DNA recombinase
VQFHLVAVPSLSAFVRELAFLSQPTSATALKPNLLSNRSLYREKSLGTDYSAERLPADQLESEVRGALLRTVRRHDLLEAALAAGLARSGAQRRQHQDELGVVDAELTKSEEAIERYFLAFEAGTLSETTCGQRVQTLAAKIASLQARRCELVALLDTEQELTITEAHLEQFRSHVTDTIEHGDPGAQKGLLQALVARIEVESRAAVRPYFRVPLDGTGLTGLSPSDNGKVRPPSGSAPPGGLEPPTVCLEAIGA